MVNVFSVLYNQTFRLQSYKYSVIKAKMQMLFMKNVFVLRRGFLPIYENKRFYFVQLLIFFVPLHDMNRQRQFFPLLPGSPLCVVLLVLLLTACRVGKGEKPLVGGTYDYPSGEVHVEDIYVPEEETSGEESERSGDLRRELERMVPAPLTDRSEQILWREGYATSYNSETRLPNWAMWLLKGEHTSGAHKRQGVKYHEDEDVAPPRATNEDYYNSGWDRGHMCPAGDNKWSAQAMEDCFLFTNMCPQNHNLNGGDWNELEMQCRKWAKRFGEIYIVCGPILFRSAHKTIGRNKVVVPEAFFKVVLRMGDDPKAIGFIYRNEAGNRPKGDYVNSLRQVQRITGITFFPQLAADVRERLLDDADLDDWW